MWVCKCQLSINGLTSLFQLVWVTGALSKFVSDDYKMGSKYDRGPVEYKLFIRSFTNLWDHLLKDLGNNECQFYSVIFFGGGDRQISTSDHICDIPFLIIKGFLQLKTRDRYISMTFEIEWPKFHILQIITFRSHFQCNITAKYEYM